MNPENLLGMVFDLDGTLADSRLDFAAMRAETGCPEGVGLLEYIDRLDSREERARAHEIIHYYETDGAVSATWIDGAEPLLHRLAAASLPIGIFTRNSRQSASLMIDSLGIPCDMLVAREDAAAKPDPEGLKKIASRFRLRTSDMLCTGDFLYDLQAAANAGMPSCLYDPQGDSPYAEEADLVIRHFEELGRLVFGDSL